MTHPRTVIRNAFVDRLKGQVEGVYRTNAENRVFAGRIAPVDVNDDDELPAILVYSRTDKRDPEKDYSVSGSDAWTQSDLQVVVEAIIAGNEETADDRLDVLAAQIEAALEDFDIPTYESARVRLGDTDIDVVTEGFRRPVAAVGLCYHVRYFNRWRPQPDEVRPTSVDVAINGGQPEPLIRNDERFFP